MKSKKWTLQVWDWIKGALLGVGAAAGDAAYQAVQAGALNGGHVNLNIGAIGSAALGGLVMYVGHKFVTDDNKVAVKTLDKAGYIPVKKDRDVEFK
jgi:hypothetical protein